MEKSVIALGFFDGVHLGHAALLNRCRAVADRLGIQAAVMTFDLHPDTLVTGKPVPLINSRADREDLFRRVFGMDRVVFYHFTAQTMHMPWQSFLDDYVIGELGAAHVVCGHDFHFGDRGAGNPERLVARCRELGVGSDVIDKITLDGITVSSTYIRQLIAAGEMEQANRFLGHPHLLSGRVEPGPRWAGPSAFPRPTCACRRGCWSRPTASTPPRSMWMARRIWRSQMWARGPRSMAAA